MIDIKDIFGNIRYSTPINEGSKRKYLLMKEDYIILKFSLDDPVHFKLGDGIDNELGVFELVDLYKPAYNTSTGGYDYEIRLDAYYWKWKNKKFFYSPDSGSREAGWNLTDTLKVHMDVFLKNLEILGYKYHDKTFKCEIDKTVDTSSKLISYENINMIDALNQTAESFECEWWVEEEVIHFGRCEDGDPVDFELGMNVSKMDRSDSQDSYATRIYAFGSTRNIPPTYRKKLIFDVKQVSGRDIADTSRVLKSEYFPSDSILCERLQGKAHIDGSVVNENREYKCTIINALSGGTYSVLTAPVQFMISGITGTGSTEYYPPVGTYYYQLDLYYTKDGKAHTVYSENKDHYHSDKNINGFRDTFNFPSSFNIEKGAVNLEAKLTVRAQTEVSPRGVSAQILSFDLILENLAQSVNTTIAFVTGANAGKSFNAVYNPGFFTGEAANVLRLPEGITASLGDTYTIDNIVKGNVPSIYFSDDKGSQTAEGIVTKHLMMPEGVPYIDAYEGMTEEEAVEQIVIFDDIYPKREKLTGMVTTHTYTDTIDNPDGTKTSKDWLAWRFKDSDLGFHFSNEYRLDGEDLRIVFQSGPLAGMDFEVTFNPYDSAGGDKYQPEKSEDGTWNKDAQVYEIKRNDDYGRMLPDDILHPTDQGGDTYILYGYDPQFVSDKLIPDAEKEVEERAREYIEELKQDPSTYNTTMMSDYIYGINPETGKQDPDFAKSFTVGQKVNLINKAYFEEGRISRIIGLEYNLDIPYDSPIYTVGETAPYSRIGELENKIDSLTYRKEKSKQQVINNGSSSSGGGSTIAKLIQTINVTSSNVGYIKTGDMIPAGTTLEEIFINMLSQKASAKLEGKLSSSNDVEFGTQKGYITYTAYRNGQGPMEQAYYDNNPNNKLFFSEEVGGVQTTTRQLQGNYTQGETYFATVIYAASEDGSLPKKELTSKISVNVKRKWFAGVCSSIPTTSSEVRALGSNGLYNGPSTYKFQAGSWKIVAVCVPSDTVKEISIASSYGNFIENGKVCIGPVTISVEGVNGSDAIDYKMWVIQTQGLNDPDSFTFKTA